MNQPIIELDFKTYLEFTGNIVQIADLIFDVVDRGRRSPNG